MSEQEAGQNEPLQKLSPGVVLARARNSQGLSLAEVAEHLKITESYVRAIEESAFDTLPQAAFVRGYIRNYAKMVGLSGQQLVDDFDQFTGNSSLEAPRLQGGRKVKPLRAHSFPSPTHALALVLVISLAGLSYYLWNHWLNTEPATQIAVTTELPVPADAASDDASVLQVEPVEPLPDEAAVVTVEEAAVVTVDETAVVTVDETPDLTKTLLIDFSQECWVEIRDANNVVVLSGTQPAGSSIDMKVQPPASVHFGNTHGVEKILFDGELFSQLDLSDRVASIELTSG